MIDFTSSVIVIAFTSFCQGKSIVGLAGTVALKLGFLRKVYRFCI